MIQVDYDKMNTRSASSTRKEVGTDGDTVEPGIRRQIPTTLDLFCGAGGLSLGFQQAGFRILRAVDSWAPAVETYRKNLGDHVVREKISEEAALPVTTVIIGGPPCQGFSSAGRRRDDDERNSLVTVFGRIVARNASRRVRFRKCRGIPDRSRWPVRHRPARTGPSGWLPCPPAKDQCRQLRRSAASQTCSRNWRPWLEPNISGAHAHGPRSTRCAARRNRTSTFTIFG